MSPGIWLPPGTNATSSGSNGEHQSEEVKRGNEKFRRELVRMMQAHKIAVFVGAYVMDNQPKNGKVICIGQPTGPWLDAAWQRIRLFASGIIERKGVSGE